MMLGNYNYSNPSADPLEITYSNWILIPQAKVRESIRYQLNVIEPCEARLETTLASQDLIRTSPSHPAIFAVEWDQGLVSANTQSFSIKVSAVRMAVRGVGGKVSLQIALD